MSVNTYDSSTGELTKIAGNSTSGSLNLVYRVKVTTNSELQGKSLTATNGTLSVTAIVNSSNVATFNISEGGTWIITEPINSNKVTVNLTYYGQYELRLNSYTIYGMRIEGNESVPGNKISYHIQYNGKNVDNYDYRPAYMNYPKDAFDYGDWRDDEFFMPRPCMVKYNGTVDYYLNPDDYTKKIDGITNSDVANTSYSGNAMMEWGRDGKKIWYKVVPDTGDWDNSVMVYFSDVQVDEGFKCWSFYDANNNQIPHFYTRIYEGSNISSKLRSISGQTPQNTLSGVTELNYAKANNVNSAVEWYITVYADWILINLLLMLISQSTDTQTAFGNGHYTGGSSASNLLKTGTLNTKGLFYGTNGTGKAVKVFGMENWYADRWERMAGLILSNGVMKYKMTYSTADTSTATSYDEADGGAGSGYLSGPSIATNLSSSYIINQGFKSDGAMLPKTFGGSSSTHYCDATWSATGNRYALVGGGCLDGFACGAFCVRLYTALSGSYWDIGASLSLKPLLS